MSPRSAICNIIPTYISTDLVTPGRRRRETLPAIGVYQKTIHDEDKLWGQETKLNGELAYHRFKPSHLKTTNVVVTHRHFGNRICNIQGKDQPVVLTTLLPSKCRLNDQRIPPPFYSPMVQEHYIPEPCPEHLKNSYFSHQCKYQVFPTDGIDLPDTGGLRPKSSKKTFVTKNTAKAIDEMTSRLYGTTTYENHFEESRKKARPRSSAKKKRMVNLGMCKKCGLRIRKAGHVDENSEKSSSSNGYIVRVPQSVKKPFWPCWPPGEKNITNNPPGYPKIILPKYCIHPKKSKTGSFCKCSDQIPYVVSRNYSTEERRDDKQQNEEDISVKYSSEYLQLRTKKLIADTLTTDEKQREPSKPKMPLSTKRKRNRSPLKIERGFQTDAHHKFHQRHNDVIPDLRDATKAGRKHNFHGFNVHIFRG